MGCAMLNNVVLEMAVVSRNSPGKLKEGARLVTGGSGKPDGLSDGFFARTLRSPRGNLSCTLRP